MVQLMEALQRFDRDLARTVDVTVEPVLFLENVEAGSIKSWVATVLRSTDDESVRSGDWKKVLGEYLVKGKYVLLEKLEGAESIAQQDLLTEIQKSLLLEAAQVGNNNLQGLLMLTRTQIAAHVSELTRALAPLTDGDSATFESGGRREVRFNRTLDVDQKQLDEVLTSRFVSNKAELILKVKKPDFLGSSMWEFHFNGHAIQASVLDDQWLLDFRRDGLGVRPGASLRAIVLVEIALNEEQEELSSKYTLLKVLSVIPPSEQAEQLRLPSST